MGPGSSSSESYQGDPAERFARVAAIFEGARVLEQEALTPYLREDCGEDDELRAEVESLLRMNDDSEGPLDDDSSALDSAWALDALRADEARHAPPAPDHIGPYEILRELGAGGMGRVYLARRGGEDFEKTVAVKVLRAGLHDSGLLSRFRSERRILAGLDHPYVANLLDGGSTDAGQPYLVMEYVEGLDLLNHAEQQGLDSNQPERLADRRTNADVHPLLE